MKATEFCKKSADNWTWEIVWKLTQLNHSFYWKAWFIIDKKKMEQIWVVNDCHEHCAIPSFVKLKCEQRVGRMVLIPRKSHYVICCCCSSVLERKKLTRDSIIGKAAFTIYNNLKIWTYTSKLYSTTINVFCWIRLNSSFLLTVKSLLLSKLRVL